MNKNIGEELENDVKAMMDEDGFVAVHFTKYLDYLDAKAKCDLISKVLKDAASNPQFVLDYILMIMRGPENEN